MRKQKRSRGFSLIELMCSVAILLIVGGSAMYALVVYQKSYSSNSVRQDLQSSVRSATELLQQEIGQAGAMTGLNGSSTITLPSTDAAITGNTTTPVSNTVTLPSGYAANMWVGEKLQFDITSANAETVTTTAVSPTNNTFTALFQYNHTPSSVSNPVIIGLAGIFPNGILSSSSSTALNIIGDVNNDGHLYFVQYTCNQSVSTPPTDGYLKRSITQLPATTATTADTLVQNVVANPDGSGCFAGCFTASTCTSYGAFGTVIPSVGITLTTQASTPDAQTGANCPTNSNPTGSGCYATFTNSFLNLSPRNVIYGLDLYTASSTNTLQALPPSSYYP